MLSIGHLVEYDMVKPSPLTNPPADQGELLLQNNLDKSKSSLPALVLGDLDTNRISRKPRSLSNSVEKEELFFNDNLSWRHASRKLKNFVHDKSFRPGAISIKYGRSDQPSGIFYF